MTAFKLILLGFLALLGLASPTLARCAGTTVTVVEYFDALTGRFFMTADPLELQALDVAGLESPKVRTGLQFDALPADVDTCETRSSGLVVCAASVVRFNYTPFDWFFYSPNLAERTQLNAPGSGFIDRGVAFKAFLPDGPGDTCTQGRVPVYRSYRNQNHRFPADLATHQGRVTTGSEDEGVTFCAEAARIGPLFDAPFVAGARGGILTEAECPLEAVAGSCVVTRNLQPPRFYDGDYLHGELPQLYVDRTGFNGVFIFTEGDASLSDRAFGTFVQFGDPGQLGLHVNTGNRITQGPSGLDVAGNFERFSAPGAVDRRLLPFRRTYDVPVELSMRFLLFVKAVDLGGGSRAAGRLRIELFDTSERRLDVIAAERRMDLVVQLYGNRFPSPEGVGREGSTFTSLGRTVVTTTTMSDSFGRLVSPVPFLETPGGFRSSNAWGYGAAFDYRIDRAALQRIIDAAREMDSTYSADVTQYQVLGYRIENDVEGPGRLGLNARDVTLQLLRR